MGLSNIMKNSIEERFPLEKFVQLRDEAKDLGYRIAIQYGEDNCKATVRKMLYGTHTQHHSETSISYYDITNKSINELLSILIII